MITQSFSGAHAINRQLFGEDGGEGSREETDCDSGMKTYHPYGIDDKKLDISSLQDINSGPKSPKMSNFPQMLLNDSKLKRSKLMTRRESQALLEGVRKNRGVQSTQSCNN